MSERGAAEHAALCVDSEIQRAMDTGGWPLRLFEQLRAENHERWLSPDMHVKVLGYMEKRVRALERQVFGR